MTTSALSIQTLLQNIEIILVETTLPANIGSAARAMKTMGLHNLHVVNPKKPLDDDAKAHAAGAQDILANINYHDNLQDALTNANIVWAASSRQRSMPQPVMSLRQACQHLPALVANSAQGGENIQGTMPRIAIVFGREDRGLTNAELAQAQYHVHIPANSDYGVLNLASAVQVFSYEVRQTLLEVCESYAQAPETKSQDNKHILPIELRTHWDEQPVNQQQLQQLTELLTQTFADIGVFDADNPRNTPKRITRLMQRTQLDSKEYNIIRSAIKHIQNLQKN